MVRVTIKWNRQSFHDVEVDTNLSASILKAQICSITGVPPERQTIMGLKGGPLKDNVDLNTAGLKQGCSLTLFGTVEGIETQAQRIKAEEKLRLSIIEQQHQQELAKQKMKAAPAGLMNLGNTCYLSAVMQFFRASEELVEEIKNLSGSFGSAAVAGGDGEGSLCAAMREFYRVWEPSTSQTLPPALVVQTFRSLFPQFATKSNGAFNQQDAAECLNALFTTFTKQTKKVDDLFGFDFDVKMKNLENDDEPEIKKTERSTVLPCHMGTQLNTIDHMHQGIRLSLDEKLTKFSELSNRQCNYSKTMRIKSLPLYLIVHFVRFEWKKASELSRTEAGKAKICRKVQFSSKFDLYEFASDELKRDLQLGRYVWSAAKTTTETPQLLQPSPSTSLLLSSSTAAVKRNSVKEQEEKPTSSSSSSSSLVSEVFNRDSIEIAEASSATTAATAASDGHTAAAAAVDHSEGLLTNEAQDESNITLTNGHYELVSIVTHQGRTTDSGHYVAWTKKDEDSWYKLDDETVTVHRWKDLDLTGGRSDFHIAVLLMYKRKSFTCTSREAEIHKEKIKKEKPH